MQFLSDLFSTSPYWQIHTSVHRTRTEFFPSWQSLSSSKGIYFIANKILLSLIIVRKNLCSSLVLDLLMYRLDGFDSHTMNNFDSNFCLVLLWWHWIFSWLSWQRLLNYITQYPKWYYQRTVFAGYLGIILVYVIKLIYLFLFPQRPSESNRHYLSFAAYNGSKSFATVFHNRR